MSDLDKAIQLACHAHAGQRDKAGQPYILHPLRLMFTQTSTTEKITAVLHDVVEDSEVSLHDLSAHGFSQAIIDALDCLTRKRGETYENFIQRIAQNPLATRIKIADLNDNIDVTRLDKLTEKDLARIQKYHQSLSFLMRLV